LWAQPGHLVVLALDNPGPRNFELHVDVQPVRDGDADQGVVLGYRRDQNGLGRFFRVHLTEPPKATGTSPSLSLEWVKRRDARDERPDSQSPEPVSERVSLPPRPPNAWRHLDVRATRHRITVVVDGGPPVTIDLRRLRLAPWPPDEVPDPRGLVGAWVTGGM